ncbi:BspA family leucine-rich repeat surface protein [Aurantibacter sp.]|uniref:BspA family leucine-rich repeat surface protein n=1 Tax=Aurantibacter sp. TaxID=2807103 RepID=UPI0032677D83
MRKVLLSTLFLLFSIFGFSQWTQTHGPEGGNLNEIVKVGDDLVLNANSGGIYRSTDNGNSWTVSNSGIPVGASIYKLIEDSGVLYISVAQKGIYKSTDAGVNWIAINSGIEYQSFYSLHANGSTIYAGNANGGISYSNNGGQSWIFVGDNVSGIQFQDFEVFNSKIYATGRKLFESSDQGLTWQERVIEGVGSNGFRTLLAANGVFYAGGQGELFISYDNLNTWVKAPLNTYATIISIQNFDNTIYVNGGNGSYYFSEDQGLNWTAVKIHNTDNFINSVFIEESMAIATTSKGLFQTSDYGNSWVLNNNGINAVSIKSLFANDSNIFVGSQNQGLYISHDNGGSYQSINNGLESPNSNNPKKIIEVNNVLYINSYNGIYASNNNGQSWQRKLDPGPYKYTEVFAHDNGTFVSAYNKGLFLSDDNAENWTELSIDLISETTGLTSIAIQENLIVISTGDGELVLSENLGNSWSKVSVSDNYLFINHLEIEGSKIYAATNQGLFISQNLGVNWNKVNDEYINIVDFVLESNLIYAATEKGFKYTTEQHNQWFSINEGLGEQYLTKLIINNETIFAGTYGSSVWKLPKEQANLPDYSNGFVTKWKTDNSGLSNDNQITIPTYPGESYNYTVDWGDGSTDSNLSGNSTHTYDEPGIYTVRITGDFPRIYFNKISYGSNLGDEEKLISIEHWGENQWTSMDYAFSGCINLKLNAIDSPNLSTVFSANYMFYRCYSFNGAPSDSNWDVSKITSMYFMFADSNFNQDISTWNVSNVTNMASMFQGTNFKYDINNWDVSNVRSMASMFSNSQFNEDISSWDVSRVQDMNYMFFNTYFNHDISGWDVSDVRNMTYMFNNSQFDQNIGNWDVQNVTRMNEMFDNSDLTKENYDKILNGWSQLPNLQNGISLGANDTQYCEGEAGRQKLINEFGWNITDFGEDCDEQIPFVTTWKTDNYGSSNNNQITIPTNSNESYNYTVDWGDGTLDSGITGDITHTYASIGTYSISISGKFPGIYFNAGYYNNNDHDKIISIDSWGNNRWVFMNNAFSGCRNLDMKATDIPDFSRGLYLYGMFTGCTSLIGNDSINLWDMSDVRDTGYMFSGATLFNQPLNNWNVSKVYGMYEMFKGATSFDQDLSNWNIVNIQSMNKMFEEAGLSYENYDNTLMAWSKLQLKSDVNFNAGNSQYCESEVARQKIIDDFGWTIIDAGKSTLCPLVVDFALRINAGGSEIEYNGDSYVTDSFFNTGSTLVRPQTGLPEPHQSFRFSRSQEMSYDIPLEDGEYTVNLYFAELWFGATGGGAGGVGSRVFDVSIEGELAHDNLDVFAEVGADVMLMKSYTATIIDGILDIDFNSTDEVGGERHPIINAIEILGQTSAPSQRPFVTTWKTDNQGVSNDNQITIPTYPSESYNYNVDWGDGTSDSGVTGDITHSYSNPGIYEVSIFGDFPRIYFNNMYNYKDGDEEKIISINQWGENEWSSMNSAFAGCSNVTLSAIDVPNFDNLTEVEMMFAGCYDFTGNDSMSEWDFSRVSNMSGMFIANHKFNTNIGNWDTSNVIDMSSMFLNAKIFNQDISNWKTDKVVRLDFIFSGAEKFNQNIGQWNVSNVTRLDGTFTNAKEFNQDIGNWDVSKVEVMFETFANADAFDQDLSRWNVEQLKEAPSIFYNSGLSNINYDKLLIGWSQLPLLQENVEFHADQNTYCSSEEARQLIIDTYGWAIIDAGKSIDCLNSNPFITTWKTDNPGASNDNQITIPTFSGEAYNYFVDWGDGNTDSGVTGDITHTYSSPGIYEVSIFGDFPRIYFVKGNAEKDNKKLLEINQWGEISWLSMQYAFQDCTNLDLIASDIPDLSNVTSLVSMFGGCTNFSANTSVTNWDTSTILEMSGVFQGTMFNQNIGSWNTSNVESMDLMFDDAKLFNQDIGSWDVSNVKGMVEMFYNADSFNQDISNWDVSSAVNMWSMFVGAEMFNQNLADWDVSNVENFSGFLDSSGLSDENYNKMLVGWSQLPSLQNGVQFGASQNQYCSSKEARQLIIDTYGWAINDAGKASDCLESNDFAFRINAGGSDFEFEDKTYISDNYFNTGSTLDRPQTGLPEPYQSMRFSRSQEMSYDIPLENGEYTVNLYFAELWFGATGGGAGGVGSRVFDVTIEGQTAEDNLDVFAQAGADAMLKKTHTVTVIDGILNINFDSRDAVGGERHPIINAIEILGEVSEHAQSPFVTTWKTDNPGTSNDNQITIPTYPGETYNYSVDWGDGKITTGEIGDATHTYSVPGTYQVSISGDFPRIYFNSEGDKDKIVSINQWGQIKWKSMQRAFSGCENMNMLSIDIPDLANVTSIDGMFTRCTNFIANESIAEWDTSTITLMGSVFNSTMFNQDIGNWDTSKVTSMDLMFYHNRFFNQDIGDWDVSSLISMVQMFEDAESFNQDISNWDVSNVVYMWDTFYGATLFDQNLASWNVSKVEVFVAFLDYSGLSNENYNNILIGWSQLPTLKNDITLFVTQNQFCEAKDARQKLMDDFGWRFNDGGMAADCSDTTSFITTWKTDNPGTSNDNQITIPTYPGEMYNYSVNWGDGTTDSGVTGDITHTYSSPGIYEVSISGDFAGIQFDTPQSDKSKIVNITQWGEIVWKQMNGSYWGCSNLDVVAIDTPDLSNVETLNGTFVNCYSLIGNSSFNDWETESILEIENLFAGAMQFNQPLNQWNVSNVIDMTGTFSNAKTFNQPLSNWDVGNVEEMWDMFGNASSFNQDISDWNVSNVVDFTGMFAFAESFNQDLGNWQVNNATDMSYMFNGSAIESDNYDAILIGWSQNSVLQQYVHLDVEGVLFCEGKEARQKLIDDFGWSISDAGINIDCEASSDFALRINAGGEEALYNGETFMADAHSNTGSALYRPQTGLDEPFNTFRYSRSQEMSYAIPLEDGDYRVNLYFAELWFGARGGGAGGVGSRVFDVSIEDILVADNLDVFAEVGAETMLNMAYSVTVTGGVLNIDFDSRDEVGGERHPIINAIEIVSGSSSNSGKVAVSKQHFVIENDMRIYPNQVSDFATLSLEEPVEIQQVLVFDMIGRLIKSYNPNSIKSSEDYILDVNELQQGTYIVKLIDNQGVSFQKQMVVKRQ